MLALQICLANFWPCFDPQHCTWSPEHGQKWSLDTVKSKPWELLGETPNPRRGKKCQKPRIQVGSFPVIFQIRYWSFVIEKKLTLPHLISVWIKNSFNYNRLLVSAKSQCKNQQNVNMLQYGLDLKGGKLRAGQMCYLYLVNYRSWMI